MQWVDANGSWLVNAGNGCIVPSKRHCISVVHYNVRAICLLLLLRNLAFLVHVMCSTLSSAGIAIRTSVFLDYSCVPASTQHSVPLNDGAHDKAT